MFDFITANVRLYTIRCRVTKGSALLNKDEVMPWVYDLNPQPLSRSPALYILSHNTLIQVA